MLKSLRAQFLCAVAVMALFLSGLGFIAKSSIIPCTRANVEIIENVGVFAYCKPDCGYDVLGTVKLPGLVSSERADRCIETLLKRAKKDFPSTEALILNTEFSKAECVKFRDVVK